MGLERALHVRLIGKAHLVGHLRKPTALGEQTPCAVETQVESVGAGRDAGSRLEMPNETRRSHARRARERFHAGGGIGLRVPMLKCGVDRITFIGSGCVG